MATESVRLLTTTRLQEKASKPFDYKQSMRITQVIMAACRNLGIDYSPNYDACLVTKADTIDMWEADQPLSFYKPEDGMTLYLVDTGVPERRSSASSSLHQMFVDKDRFERQGLIGHGGYSVVYRSLDRKTGEIVAEKEFSQMDSKANSMLVKEVETCMRLERPNLLRVRGWSAPSLENNGDGSQSWTKPVMVVDFHENGSLKHVVDRSIELNNTQMQIVFYGIADGLMHLHRNGIYHRDVKPDNALLNASFEPVISDFGLAKIMVEVSGSGACDGTYRYMAPEVVHGLALFHKADEFAYGLTIYAVLKGQEPCRDIDPRRASQWMASDPAHRPPLKGIPPNYASVISRLWAHEMNDRPSCAEVLEMFKAGQLNLPDVNMDVFNRYVESLSAYDKPEPGPAEERPSQVSSIRESMRVGVPDDASGSSVAAEILRLTSQKATDELFAKGRELKDSNPEIAIQYFRAAADLGMLTAQKWSAGLLVKLGKRDEAEYYMKMAADADDVESQLWHGSACYKKEAWPEAVKYLKMALSKGKAHAAYLLGMCYKDGKGVPKNDAEAAKLFKAGSDHGDENALYEWARCLSDGTGVKADLRTGLGLMKQSADKGNLDAMNDLGRRLCMHGEAEKGMELLTDAANKGHVNAMLNCARFNQNPALSTAWFKKLSDLGLATGHCNYGYALLTGRGIEQNPKEGCRLLSIAAEAGDRQAEYYMAIALAEGKYCSKDFTKARHYMITSAKLGFSLAQYEMGKWYIEGKYGTPKNAHQGAEWVKCAADQKLPVACQLYGELLATGRGVLVNPREAERYRALALKLSNKA